jgi:hypothetical protein
MASGVRTEVFADMPDYVIPGRILYRTAGGIPLPEPLYICARNGGMFTVRSLTRLERAQERVNLLTSRLDLWLMFKMWAVERYIRWGWIWLQCVNPFDAGLTLASYRALRSFATTGQVKV